MRAHERCCIDGCAREVIGAMTGFMVGGSVDVADGCRMGDTKGLVALVKVCLPRQLGQTRTATSALPSLPASRLTACCSAIPLSLIHCLAVVGCTAVCI